MSGLTYERVIAPEWGDCVLISDECGALLSIERLVYERGVAIYVIEDLVARHTGTTIRQAYEGWLQQMPAYIAIYAPALAESPDEVIAEVEGLFA